MRQALKIITGIIFAALAVWLLFAPEKQESADGKIHLKYWLVSASKGEMPFHMTEFNRANPNIIVEPTLLPWTEHEKKILTSILSENPPDVVFLVTPVAKWATRLALTPLDSLIERDKFDTAAFFPALWKEMSFRNHVYSVPLYSNAYAFFYNKRIFKEAGLNPEKPPRTWDEVMEYSKKIALKDAKGNYSRMGFIPTYGNVQTAIIMAWELGAKILTNSGTKVNLTDPAVVKAMDWMVKYHDVFPLKEVSSFSAGFGYADQHGFISEKVAMMILDNSFPDQIKMYKPGLEYGVAEIPTFEGCPPVSLTGSWWLAIPRGAKNKEAAWQFIKFAVQKNIELAEALKQKDLLFPANRQAANDEKFLGLNKENKTFVDLLEHSESPAIIPLAHDAFWREFGIAQEKSIHKIQSPYEALKQAEKSVQAQLTDAIEYNNYVMNKLGIK